MRRRALRWASELCFRCMRPKQFCVCGTFVPTPISGPSPTALPGWARGPRSSSAILGTTSAAMPCTTGANSAGCAARPKACRR
jgi:hypothetical protein